MDVCESEKHTAVDTPRLPLLPSERNKNAPTTGHRSRTREVSSRYRSPTPSVPRRCPSPNVSRTLPINSQVASKRAISADRRRPLTPPSPSSLSTPVQDSSANLQLSRRLSTGSKIPESLWPSTMRSLNTSFQSDIISIPITKKEKPISNNISSDRALKPSSNVAHKQAESPARSRKPTPERKRSPLKGKNAQDQSENAKPVDGLQTRMIDQHRWPSRTAVKSSSNTLKKSVDLADKSTRVPSTPIGTGSSSLKKTSQPRGNIKTLRKTVSDAKLSDLEHDERIGSEANSADDYVSQVSRVQKLVASSLSDRLSLITPTVRSQSLSSSGSRPPSPSMTSVSRGVSPARARPSTPPSRGVSPSRTRSSSISSQSNTSTSVLSFIVDVKKGKKGLSYIEDAHHLRLMHNRYLQWRFANARAEAVLYTQKVAAERTLYNVWNSTLALWDSVIRKRTDLQQLKLELKMNAILNDQMAYLDDWALLERDHISSLVEAWEDLKATILRLPVIGGAKADIDSLKVAICSAVDVMRAMGSSICSLLSRVEGMNALVSELANVAAEEKAMLDQCEALLASTAALQVENMLLLEHLLQVPLLSNQIKQNERNA